MIGAGKIVSPIMLKLLNRAYFALFANTAMFVAKAFLVLLRISLQLGVSLCGIVPQILVDS